VGKIPHLERTGKDGSMTAAKDQLEIDLALAVAELRRHGGTETQVEALRAQFRALANDEDAKPTDKQIPE
jgi:hypothetical protein